MTTNLLTIDIEEWFHPTLIRPYVDKNLCKFHKVADNTQRILDLLSEFDIKATFFVLGEVADKFPGLVKDLYDRGHEIATHGYSHNLVFSQTPGEFRDDLQRSIKLLEDITGEKVLGCRVPTWSITKESLWAIEIIKECGLVYDSSISPAIFNLYKGSNFRLQNGLLRAGGDGFIEFPQTTIRLLGRDISFGGGFFLRLYPYSFTKRMIQRFNRQGRAVMVYFHPWELDPDIIKFPIGLKNRFISYINLKTMEKKIRALFSDFNFTSLSVFIAKQAADDRS